MTLYLPGGGGYTLPTRTVIVRGLADLPAPIGGVITLPANYTYWMPDGLDLLGSRLVCSQNNVLMGASSENSVLTSTGLTGAALISSAYSLPVRFLTITAETALDLDASANEGQAIDWNGVNLTDCGEIGTLKGHSNAIFVNCAFLNSGGMVFDGEIGTVGFDGCLFLPAASQSAVEIAATATITRRFRVIYSAAVIIGAQSSTGFDVVDSASIVPDEGFILDTVDCSGGGGYLPGIDETSNKALFAHCKGITNTAVNGQMYMRGNATATTIADTSTWFKAAGTTTASTDNAKYVHTANRLTNDATVARKYLIQATLSFNAGNGNQCEFGFFDSKLGSVRTPSQTRATANAAGRAESVTMTCVVQHEAGDYIEIHCRNTSSATDITITDLNVVISEIQ